LFLWGEGTGWRFHGRTVSFAGEPGIRSTHVQSGAGFRREKEEEVVDQRELWKGGFACFFEPLWGE